MVKLEVLILNDIIDLIIEPSNLYSLFEDENEFIHWLRLGTIEDLKHTLLVFVDAQMFYQIQLILKEIVIKQCHN